MEAIEFYLWEGEVRYRVGGEERVLTQRDRDIIEYVLDTLRQFFPEALQAVSEECSRYVGNKYYFDFRRVDLFVRCNFSEHDVLSFDLKDGVMHFEDVKCPRRGICKYEGVICRPQFKANMTQEESRVAVLYGKGFLPEEISKMLRKSIKTVKNQLTSVKKRLHLGRTRDLIKIFSVYNITIWE